MISAMQLVSFIRHINLRANFQHTWLDWILRPPGGGGSGGYASQCVTRQQGAYRPQISLRAFDTVSLFHSGSTTLFITFRCSFEHSCFQDSLGTRSTQHFHYKVSVCSV